MIRLVTRIAIALILFITILPITTNAQLSKPRIDSIFPTSGPIGTQVTIYGRDFNSSADSTTVFFGPVKAQITYTTDTLYRVTVPMGATYQPVTIITNARSASSRRFFTVTIPGASTNEAFAPGSFLPKMDLTAGTYPHDVNLGDYNGDGKPDLFVSKGSSEKLGIFNNISVPGAVTFKQPTEIRPVGRHSEATAIEDYDADGRLDIAVVNSLEGMLSVFRNQVSYINDTFHAQRTIYPAGLGAYSLAAGDFNNDGLPDLATGENGGTRIVIFKNKSVQGVINFDTLSFTTDAYPYGLAISDFDGDGRQDIVISAQGSGSILVHRNVSVGDTIRFAARVNIASAGAPYALAVGDIDDDGKTDIIASGAGGLIYVIRNVSTPGALLFEPRMDIRIPGGRMDAALGDLDGDGKVDVAVASYDRNSVCILKNLSVPGSLQFLPPVEYPVGEMPGALIIGDIDGDSKPDIVTANYSGSTVSILRNIHGLNLTPVIDSYDPTSGFNGVKATIKGRNFTNASVVSFGGTKASAFTVVSDTLVEATIAKGATGDVKITTPYGDAIKSGFTFTGPTIHNFSPVSANRGQTITITGTNLAGITQVYFGGIPATSFTKISATTIQAVVGNVNSGLVKVVSANGDAELNGFSFGQPKILSFFPESGSIGSIVNIDVQNIHPSADSLIVHFGAVRAKIIGVFGDTLKVEVPAGTTYKPITLTSNRLIAHSSRPFIATYENDSLQITPVSFSLSGNYPVGGFPRAIDNEDFDGDGKADLVVVNGTGNSISLFKNTSQPGGLTFASAGQYATGASPIRVAVADMDGDGKKDIIVCNNNSGHASGISIFKNTSTANAISFSTKADYPAGMGATGLAVSDLNSDGRNDIVVASGNSNSLSFFINKTLPGGTIHFDPKQDMAAGGHVSHVIAADVDNDNLPDLITTISTSRELRVYRNRSADGVLLFDAPAGFSTGNFPTSLAAGDVNDDGKTDIIVNNYGEGSATVWLNHSYSQTLAFLPKQKFKLNVTVPALADLNGDARLELIAGSYVDGKVAVLENRINALQTNPYSDSVDFETGEYDSYVSVGDFDGDGKPDIAVVSANSASLKILRSRTAESYIATVSPLIGVEGTSVTIRGSRLGGMTNVSFGGSAVRSFKVVSPNEIVAVVGSGSSGKVVVNGPSGSAEFGRFVFVPDVFAEDSSTFCLGDSVILRSTDIKNNQWYRNGELIPGATAQRFVAKEGGDYTVRTFVDSSVHSRNVVHVRVIGSDQPTIMLDTTGVMYTYSGTGQWYHNGNMIPGATGAVHKPVSEGLYTFTAISNGCISIQSAPFVYRKINMVDLGNNQHINMYPNPVQSEVRLAWQINGNPKMTIEISDAQGRPVLTKPGLSSGGTVNVQGLQNGIYYIRIYNPVLGIGTMTRILKQ